MHRDQPESSGGVVEAKHKHLEFIQLTITRMAANSFLLKGWCVTLIAALAALTTKDARIDVIWIAIFPALTFWGLDAFYLRQERLFRKLYDHVRVKPEGDIDYALDTRPFNDQVDGWIGTLLSKTLLPFYGAVLTAIVVIWWLVSRTTSG